MALVIGKSKHITDRDNNVLSGASRQGGLVRNGAGACEVATGDSADSRFLLLTVPSNARIISLLLSSDGIAGVTGDVGLYEATQDGAKEVDRTFFAAAFAMTGALDREDVTYAGGTNDIANSEKMIWEALGLEKDPQKFYDIAVTLTGASGGDGTIAGQVNFVI